MTFRCDVGIVDYPIARVNRVSATSAGCNSIVSHVNVLRELVAPELSTPGEWALKNLQLSAEKVKNSYQQPLALHEAPQGSQMLTLEGF